MGGSRHRHLARTEVVIFPEAELPAELRAQVLRLRAPVWTGDAAHRSGPTHDPALRPLSMVLIHDGRVVSALDILSKDIAHQGEAYAASGLSMVVTDSSHRDQGFGRQLVEAAREAIARGGADLGIFTCDPPLRAFYERAGWQALIGTVLLGGTPEAPIPSDRFEKVTMGQFFSPRARRHARAFVGSRIALYPGEIDKLW